MKKADLIEHVGGQAELARIVGVTSSAVHCWPELLTTRITDRVLGAMWRKGIKIPKEWKKG